MITTVEITKTLRKIESKESVNSENKFQTNLNIYKVITKDQVTVIIASWT